MELFVENDLKSFVYVCFSINKRIIIFLPICWGIVNVFVAFVFALSENSEEVLQTIRKAKILNSFCFLKNKET